jgi:hypothetical protein
LSADSSALRELSSTFGGLSKELITGAVSGSFRFLFMALSCAAAVRQAVVTETILLQISRAMNALVAEFGLRGCDREMC